MAKESTTAGTTGTAGILTTLTPEELEIIQFMRQHGPYVDFTIEKRPDREHPDGKLARILMTRSILIGNSG